MAERDSAYALCALGFIYETGATGIPDTHAACLCYERAAEQGSIEALFNLGRLLSGEGRDEQARIAYETAAERGHLPSMARLGEMLLRGRGGPSNPAVGWGWLEKAAANGQIWAQRTLLAIEDDNARSLFQKLSVKIRIVRLALMGARAMLKDPNSDKVI